MSRELDKQIAALMGWTWNGKTAWSPTGSANARVRDDGTPIDDPWPFYSTDIAAAWEVVEKISGPEDRNFNIGRRSYGTGEWKASFHWRDGSREPAYGNATTAPEAICRAALAAFKEKNDASQ
jgi:hypothetical protein